MNLAIEAEILSIAAIPSLQIGKWLESILKSPGRSDLYDLIDP